MIKNELYRELIDYLAVAKAHSEQMVSVLQDRLRLSQKVGLSADIFEDRKILKNEQDKRWHYGFLI